MLIVPQSHESVESAALASPGRFQCIVEQLRHHFPSLFPVGPNKKPPDKWGQFQTRVAGEEEYAWWFNHYRDFNALIITGAINRIFVAECDSVDAVEYFEKRGHAETWTARTRRGFHFYFRHPGFRVRNSAAKIYEHLDVRGDGGYVIGPGGISEFGFVYSWEPGHSPDDLELAGAPAWLLELLKPPPERPAEPPKPFTGTISNYARAARDQELKRAAEAPEGQRNQTLNDVAFALGQLVGGGELDAADIASALHAIATQWPNGGHSCDTINRALAAGVELPRARPPSHPHPRSILYVTTNGASHANGAKGTNHHGQSQPDGIPFPPRTWPAMRPEARYGIADEFVTLIESQTEADPAAMLFQLLVIAGNMIGRIPCRTPDQIRHWMNLYLLVVGASSKARKGTALSRDLTLFECINKEWTLKNIVSGLSSGEGLIYAVRDARKAATKRDKDDPGVGDKRLLAIQSEFVSVLKVMRREGNTLSDTLRLAFDHGNLVSCSVD